MSVIRAVTKPYGPAKIDIQIEQGADFFLPITVEFGEPAQPINLEFATIEAWFSPQWSPGAIQVPLTIIPGDLANGQFVVNFPAAESLALVLPFPPRKTRDQAIFELGGWILHITQGGDGGPVTFRYAEGQLYLDRAPWLT